MALSNFITGTIWKIEKIKIRDNSLHIMLNLQWIAVNLDASTMKYDSHG